MRKFNWILGAILTVCFLLMSTAVMARPGEGQGADPKNWNTTDPNAPEYFDQANGLTIMSRTVTVETTTEIVTAPKAVTRTLPNGKVQTRIDVYQQQVTIITTTTTVVWHYGNPDSNNPNIFTDVTTSTETVYGPEVLVSEGVWGAAVGTPPGQNKK